MRHICRIYLRRLCRTYFVKFYGILQVCNKIQKKLIVFGKRIKKLRLDRKLTQTELADLCHVDIRTIQRIEKGQQNISLTLLLSLIGVLCVNVNDLLGDLTDKTRSINIDS